MGDAEINAELREELARRDETIAQLKTENELLRQKLDVVLRKLFGPSSEKLDADQLQLLLDPDGAKKPCAADCEPDAPAAKPEAPATRPSRRTRPGLPDDLEVIDEVMIPAEVLADPEGHRQIGEEVSERLEFDPARYWLRRIIRPTYVKRAEPGEAPCTAPLAPCLLEGSMLSPSLAANLLTSKFCDHLPFYRQEQILQTRHGVRIGRNTMCHWAEVCSLWLEPLYNILAACWAHVRRKFHEALPHHPEQAASILGLIAQLFRIEAKLRNKRAGPEAVRAERQARSRPLLHAIQEQLTGLSHCLPKSLLGRARGYTLGLWTKLEVFLEHGEIPIDNNRVENAIRPTKLGAKNWLFIGGPHTGQRSAILYTMVENIRQGGGNPFAYLKDILTRLPAMTNQDDLRPLLPTNWLAAQTAHEVPPGEAVA